MDQNIYKTSQSILNEQKTKIYYYTRHLKYHSLN